MPILFSIFLPSVKYIKQAKTTPRITYNNIFLYLFINILWKEIPLFSSVLYQTNKISQVIGVNVQEEWNCSTWNIIDLLKPKIKKL